MKLPGRHLAVGYWSRGGPWQRIEAEQSAEKIRVLLMDKLIARGKRAYLYLPVTDDVLPCSCVKVTTDSAIRQCASCYGTKSVPGYLRFLHQTIFFASIEQASFALTNITLNTVLKPNLLQIASGQTTGTIVTQAKAYTNPNNADWEIRVDAFTRAADQTIVIEFSTDGGATWTSIASVNGANKPTGSGSIQFRVTMTRAAAADASPSFEIVRIRRAMTENTNPNITNTRPNSYGPGEILILKTWAQVRDSSAEGRGRIVEHLADRSWTAPLDFFDLSIDPRDTSSCVISDGGPGSHPFVEYRSDGVVEDTRYGLEEISVSTQLGIFTSQTFVDRRITSEEPGVILVF